MQQASRTLSFYRYVGPAEAYAVQASKIITTLSSTGRTWYTPDRHLTRSEAKRYLALPATPTHRVGPYPEDELPPWIIPLQRVQPAVGEPGGGWEAATDDPLYIFDVAPLADV